MNETNWTKLRSNHFRFHELLLAVLVTLGQGSATLGCCAATALPVANAAVSLDFAEARHAGDWLRHPVYGDPSFDAFQRVAGNPMLRGAPPFEWPVNGFFFPDPLSRRWYVFVGDYGRGYLTPSSRCVLYRSADLGRSWTNVGVVLHGDPQMFDLGGHTPDVSVVYADGRYHIVYDWVEPEFKGLGGLGYAWAERPEGPWHRAAQPITRNSTTHSLTGRYERTYGATLLRRAHDWLILGCMGPTSALLGVLCHDGAQTRGALFGTPAGAPG